MIQRNGDNGKRRKNGRPPTWTPELLDIVVRAVEDGHTIHSAASLVGRKGATVEKWIKRIPGLSERIRLARGNRDKWGIGKLREHIEKGSWPALEKYLNSRVPGFSPKQRVAMKHSGEVDHRVKGPEYTTPTHETESGQQVHESDEEYFRRLIAIAEQRGDAPA